MYVYDYCMYMYMYPIVLLEHGLSSWSLLNLFLNWNSDYHFSRYGCRYNKDIRDIIYSNNSKMMEKDSEYTVEIERYDTYDYGTVHLIVCKKRRRQM